MLPDGRTVDWVDGAIVIIDQTALPGDRALADVCPQWTRWSTRSSGSPSGARPRSGVAGALGVALAARTGTAWIRGPCARLETARPTAVNLARGRPPRRRRAARRPDAVLAVALAVRDEEIAASVAMARRGADLVTELCGPGAAAADPLQHRRSVHGRRRHRPRRGRGAAPARRAGRGGRERDPPAAAGRPADHVGAGPPRHRPPGRGRRRRAVPDGPRRGRRGDHRRGPDLREPGRGQQGRLVRARARAPGRPASRSWWWHRSPLWICRRPTAAAVEIEDRDADEVLGFAGTRVAADGAGAVNPAFDVTPHHLVTAIVTESRVLRP